MFHGSNKLSIDAKGRMQIPVEYRDQLAELCQCKLVATRDLHEKCLLLYPAPRWEDLLNRLKKKANSSRQVRDLFRFLIGNAKPIQMDGNGRILIPSNLREFATLEKQVTLVGVLDNFEIWSDELWDAKNESELEVSAEVLDEIIM